MSVDEPMEPITTAVPAAKMGSIQRLQLGFFLAGCVVVGVACALVWHAFVRLPEFVTGEDGSVSISERSIGRVFSIDAVYVLIGLIAGIGIGVLAWRLFARLGWLLALLAVGGALGAGAICWLIGVLIGPRNFDARVANAQAGDRIPVDFSLHAPSAVFVWALAAVIPVLLYSSLGQEVVRWARPGRRGESAANGSSEQGDQPNPNGG